MDLSHIPEWLLPSLAAVEALQPHVRGRIEIKNGIEDDSEELSIPVL